MVDIVRRWPYFEQSIAKIEIVALHSSWWSSRKHVNAWPTCDGFPPCVRSKFIWAGTSLVYMLGTLQPWYLISPWRYFLPVVHTIPIFGKAAFRIGQRSASHCFMVNVVAANGYSTVRIIVVLKAISASYPQSKHVLYGLTTSFPVEIVEFGVSNLTEGRESWWRHRDNK